MRSIFDRLPHRVGVACIVVSLLLMTAAASGCGGDEAQVPVPATGLNTGLLGQKASAAYTKFSSRLNQFLVRITAGKYSTGLQVDSRIGQIEIPRLGIREWLIQGTGKSSLEKGAGHIEGTTVPGQGGNFGIAGDRVLYTAPFLRLDQLQAGDQMLIHMPYADMTYTVESKTNVAPTDVGVLKPKGYDSITLSTCDPPWDVQTRIIISAKLDGTTLNG